MQVLKFGGSSVADATRMSAVMDIVEKALAKDRVILVCSAISGCTDALIELGKVRKQTGAANPEAIRLFEALKDRHLKIVRRLFTGKEALEAEQMLERLFEELDTYEGDCTESFGELFSTRIIERKFSCSAVASRWLDSRKLVKVDNEGRLDEELTYMFIKEAIEASCETKLFVAPGFIASDPSGRTTTLGRGGSDYSASIYAAGSEADNLEIWTDVPGIMTANPKVVPAARTIPDISYGAALQLAENGAKVLYAPAVKPAMDKGIAIKILNTFEPKNPGTVVSDSLRLLSETWMGVTSLKVPEKEESVVCLVGEAVSNRAAVEERILCALNEAGIKPLCEVSGKEGVFFISVRTAVEDEAASAIHREFFEDRSVVNVKLFIAGYGAVGKALVELIERSRERMAQRAGRSIDIVGVSDSRHFILDMRGLKAEDIPARLNNSEENASNYMEAVLSSAPRKAVFVDCTNSHHIHENYCELLRHGINVVTSNRRSVALPYVQYAAIKATAKENGVFFRYDTTVANTLPVLESIAGSANCSDSIESIEALMSCTLNYIISAYDGTRSESLAKLLKKAQDSGLTEKDPRTDLAGKDVLRKLLILAREAGVPLEEEDVEIEPMLGSEFFDCTLEEFYTKLAESEPRFIQREDELDETNIRQRFVATLRRDPSSKLGFKAEIKMITVGIDSPFYWLNGSENVIVIHRENTSPLIIKGAGEGVGLAATGLIKDILR